MVIGHHGQNGVIVHQIVMVVNVHVHVNVINQHQIVMEHLVMDHQHKQNHVIHNHVQVLFVKMVVLYVNQFLVLNNVHSLIGHHLVNVLHHVMVHNLVIKHYKDQIVIVMIQILKHDHVVQQ